MIEVLTPFLFIRHDTVRKRHVSQAQSSTPQYGCLQFEPHRRGKFTPDGTLEDRVVGRPQSNIVRTQQPPDPPLCRKLLAAVRPPAA